MLAEVLRTATLPPRASVLDLCTGSGALAIAAARRGAREVTAVDVSRRAVLAARLNARLNGVHVRVVHGDLYAPLRRARFDVIVSNPPYVPAGRSLIAWASARLRSASFCRRTAAVLGHGTAVPVIQACGCPAGQRCATRTASAPSQNACTTGSVPSGMTNRTPTMIPRTP